MRNAEKINEYDSESLGKLIETHQARLKAFVTKHLENKSEVDDVVQDVFYQLLKTIENALTPIEYVSAWLYKVARNTIINRRKKKREEELPVFQSNNDEDIFSDFQDVLFSDEGSSSPEMEYLRSIVWTELERALSELPAEQREIFELTELDGIPVKEIAKTTNVSVNTLLSRKHYAVLFLRKRLVDLYDELLRT